MLFASVQCDGMIEGELSHSGAHGTCPHSIKVVIQKNDNAPQTYARLASVAGPKPAGPAFGRPHLVRDGPNRYRVWQWNYRERRRHWSEVMRRKDALAVMREWRKRTGPRVLAVSAEGV
jgi:hypothetical protein